MKLNAPGEHGTQFATGISTGMVHNTPEDIFYETNCQKFQTKRAAQFA